MSYVEENLVTNERVVKAGEVHWGIYVPGAIWAVLGIIFMFGDWAPLGVFLFLIGGFLLVRAFLYIYSTELAVTDKRVIAKFGLVRRQTIELLHNKVEGLIVHQGILGRILNFGTIIVNGTGSGRTPISGISNPQQFRKVALEEIDNKA